MRLVNKILALGVVLMAICGCKSTASEVKEVNPDKVVAAYVTSWAKGMPDPNIMTHINYAFGGVNETFDGVKIGNEPRFAQIVELKKVNPNLKVLLSVGGWGAGGFSEMASDASRRESFAKDCARIVKEYGIDGIDIDWEYPGSDMAGITASEDDTANFTLLMRDLRKAIGHDKLLTLASSASGEYIDFRAIMPYMDFINLMTYDMGNAPQHQAGLYNSPNTGRLTCDSSVKAHMAAGVPANKIVLGLPFYGRGPVGQHGADYRNIVVPENCTVVWDSIAMVPYIADSTGTMVFGFDNPQSLKGKCEYVGKHNLRGTMYWDYNGDNDEKELATTVYDNTVYQPAKQNVLVLNEGGGQHGPFTKKAMEWLHEQADQQGFAITELRNANAITEDFLKGYDMVIQLDFPPYTWPEAAQSAFIDYIDNGKGSWIGFHHATLLGEFDGYPMWDWFSDFMGGIKFQNYVAQLADGTVVVEDSIHPVMAGVNPKFVLPDDEWYTYNVSPRANVQVLASVDENTYTPATEIKMGDHPVVWTNPSKKARNVYFQFGHSPRLFESEDFEQLFTNALKWGLSN